MRAYCRIQCTNYTLVGAIWFFFYCVSCRGVRTMNILFTYTFNQRKWRRKKEEKQARRRRNSRKRERERNRQVGKTETDGLRQSRHLHNNVWLQKVHSFTVTRQTEHTSLTYFRNVKIKLYIYKITWQRRLWRGKNKNLCWAHKKNDINSILKGIHKVSGHSKSR